MMLDGLTGATKSSYTGDDLISRQELMNRLEDFCKWCKDGRRQGAEFVWDCVVPNMPSADAVSKGVFDQIKWERDVALQTLEEHNIGFGEAADRPTGWIPFKKRPLTDEEKEVYPDWVYIFDCPLPDDEQEILLSNGKYVWTDTFINDGECYLDGGDDIDEGMAWMPMPEPWKDGEEE